MSDTPPDYLTTPQAADRLGLTASRVRQLLRAGILTGRRVGRDWLIDRTAVDALPPESARRTAPRKKRKPCLDKDL